MCASGVTLYLMAYTLTLPVLNKYTNYFNALAKANAEFDIQVSQVWDPVKNIYSASLTPYIRNISSLEMLAKVWEAGCTSIKATHIVDFPGFRDIYTKPNAQVVTADMYKKQTGSVKYFAETVFANLALVDIYVLTEAPIERRLGDHTYRISCTNGDYYNSEIVYCANELNAFYNYIDKGHILVTVASKEVPEACIFVTDSLTLDMNYLIGAFTVYPACVKDLIQNKAFIPSKDLRIRLLKAEKNIPPKYQADYQKIKAAILTDFEKNTQSLMINKLSRKETPYVDLNNIRITTTKAEYKAGNVSIEADNLAEVVFASLNPNEEWDIFTLINIYTDWVESQFKVLALNENGSGFKTKKTFKFKINDIPLKVECFTDNTRRAVNDHLINVEELSKVMRRASCYLDEEGQDNKKDFENFVKEVSRISLKSRDILANGLPVKTLFLESDKNGYGKEATNKHPKLRFTRKEKSGFHLVITHPGKEKDGSDKKVVERKLGKFVQFCNKVNNINKHSYLSYYGYGASNEWVQTHEGGYERKDGAVNSCAKAILDILDQYVEGLTEEDKKVLVGSINKELSEAEKRSEQLLAEAVKDVGAKKSEKNGKPGYIIPGKLRNYFVEQDSLRVYDHDNGTYICVVNGRGDQGVGRDSLVARLYALHNDHMVTKQVGTLKK